MRLLSILGVAAGVLCLVSASIAAPTTAYEFSAAGLGGLSKAISSTDVANGLQGVVDAGGFHGASANSIPGLTDGVEGAALSSILADFSKPSLQIHYDFANPTDIWELRVFSSNNDERVFQTYDVEIYKPGDLDYSVLILDVTTGPFYTTYAQAGSPTAALTRVYDDGNTFLATGITSIRFTFYDVGNTGNFYVDPWSAGDPRDTGDQYAGAIVGSLIKEIDIDVVPEPGSFVALAGGLAAFGGMFARKRS